MTVILTTQEAEIRRLTVCSQPGKEFLRPFLRIPIQKRAGGGDQVVELLLS
jgi:hypothetical protein